MSGKKPTQADVARKANVSQALVSYVVNSTEDISIPPETRQRILDAVKELGYQPSKPARSLRTSRTYTIAGIIPDILNPFYPAFQRGIQDVADQHNYDLITYNTDASPDKERHFCDSLLQGRADGLIAVLFHLRARDLHSLLTRGIPIVRLEATYKQPGNYALDNLYVDNAAASHCAVSYLINKGHQHIGLLAGFQGPSVVRIAGYRQALADHQIPFLERLVQTGDFNASGGYRGMQTLLKQSPRPTAVFGLNDLIAIGALHAIQEAGLRVPEDIALVGFDDIPLARLITPKLTTISQHQEQIGRRAAEMLLARLRGEVRMQGRTEEMPFELVIRESA
jgi:LacI family transcriptional regulator